MSDSVSDDEAPRHELLRCGHALVEWVQRALARTALRELEVRLVGRDEASDDGRAGVWVSLLGLTAASATEPAKGALHVRAHYRVAPVLAEVERLHDVLGELAFAALSDTSWKLSLPLDCDEERLQTCLHMSAIVRRESERKSAPRVLHRVGLRPPEAPPLLAGMAALSGKLLGPGGVPMAGAIVQWPALGLVASTDARGLFRFPVAPASGKTLRLSVQARGRSWDVTAERPLDATVPLSIQVELDAKEE